MTVKSKLSNRSQFCMVVGLEVESQDPTWLLPTCSYLSPYKKVGWFDKNTLYMCKYVIGTCGECPAKDQECRIYKLLSLPSENASATVSINTTEWVFEMKMVQKFRRRRLIILFRVSVPAKFFVQMLFKQTLARGQHLEFISGDQAAVV